MNARETLANWTGTAAQWKAAEMVRVGALALLGEAEVAGVVHPGE